MVELNKEEMLRTSLYSYWVAIFCSLIIFGNIFALKTVTIFGLVTPAGMICFPFTFSVCDIITEVYGEDSATNTINLGLIILCLYFLFLYVITGMEPYEGWNKQSQWESVFHSSKYIVAGTLAAFYCGEKINSKILSTLKYINKNYFLRRSLASTFIGVTVDTFLFSFIAFFWFVDIELWKKLFISQLILKLGFEIIGSKAADIIIPYIKEKEGLDPVKERKWIDKYLQ